MTPEAYNTKIRRYRLKKKAVEFLGGKCKSCGWQGCIAGFSFHHLDPSKKEFGISGSRTSKWEKIEKELTKCELLCCNCHCILHSGYNNEEFLKDVERYQGRLLETSEIEWKNGNNPNNPKPKIKRDDFKTSCLKKRIYNRPSKKELLELIVVQPISKIRKLFNVGSDTTIKKWCKFYSIDYRKLSPFSLDK